jgi:transcription elongation factor Elf1
MTTNPRGSTPDPFTCPACASKDVRCNVTVGAAGHTHTCRRCSWTWHRPINRKDDAR